MTGTKQRGVALAMVVWFLAAMSLLVSGIVYQAKLDVRLAQVHVARAEVEAAGDGAIRLALASMAAGRAGSAEYVVGDHRVRIEVTPSTGLININSASLDLLTFLFIEVGLLPPEQAKVVADNVIQWRSNSSSAGGQRGRAQNFDAVEDLIRVQGVGRVLFDRVRDYIVATSGGAGAIDWSAAPPGLLQQFAKKYPREVAAASRRQDRLADLVGSAGGSGNYRVDATVIYGDRAWLRRRWVTMRSSNNGELPWRVIRTEGARTRVEV